MAARLAPRHQDAIKAKIQSSQLINFLQNHTLSKGNATPTQIDAAKFLLNKVLSNPPTDVNASLDAVVNVTIKRFGGN